MIEQAAIFLSSGLAIALLSQRDALVRRWAFPIGLIGQPFWLTATWSAQQWGIFGLAVWWTAFYLYGAWRHFGRQS